MSPPERDQPSRLFSPPSYNLDRDAQEFLIDRQARNLVGKTVCWCEQSMSIFRAFLREHQIDDAESITPTILRRFLLHLRERGHNPGGIRSIWGAVRALLRWYGDESACEGWADPLRRVKAPEAPDVFMEPVDVGDLRKMVATCKRRTFMGDRYRAIMLGLLDTVCRASELLPLDIAGLNPSSGAVLVRHGKGGKFRSVSLGARSRRELTRCLRHRGKTADAEPSLVTVRRKPLTYWGLREITRRRASCQS